MAEKIKTKEQVDLLLSEDSPLSPLERAKLEREIRQGKVRIVEDRKRKREAEQVGL